MRNRKPFFRLAGVIIAIAGTVIVIHAVPVFVWYAVLAVLILSVVFLMLNP